MDGTTYGEFQYIRTYDNINSRGPVTDVTSNDIRCNLNGYLNGPSTDVVTLKAGATVGFIADSVVTHPGPFNAWLGKAPSNDVKNWDGSGSNWFRIWEEGTTSITSSGLTWDITSSQWTFKLPSTLPTGQYLLRFEHIALHSASTVGGAQFYISCAQINVVNGGSGSPAPLASLPGAYSATDPGIQINLYWPVVSTDLLVNITEDLS